MAYRVGPWGTGAVGAEAIRGILDKPDLELAGIKVYSEDKVGRDASNLVARTRSVSVPPSTSTPPASTPSSTHRATRRGRSRRDPGSGANLVTTAFAFHPARMSPTTATGCSTPVPSATARCTAPV